MEEIFKQKMAYLYKKWLVQEKTLEQECDYQEHERELSQLGKKPDIFPYSRTMSRFLSRFFHESIPTQSLITIVWI